MRFGIIGLGRMGANIARAAIEHGHHVVGHDHDKWVLEWAMGRDIPSPVISDSQQALMAYPDLDWPAAKAVALLRHGYGGHPVHLADEQLVRS